MKRFLIPFGIFLALAIALMSGVVTGRQPAPQETPSPFVGKAAPAFSLTRLDDPQKTFSPQHMQGQVWLLNVWASWCGPCRAEHPVLVNFSKQAAAPIVGLNYTDAREDGKKWLVKAGNPYLLSAFDADGKVGTEYGAYALPETFIIDKKGVIRMKHVGPVTPEVIKEKFLPLITELNRT